MSLKKKLRRRKRVDQRRAPDFVVWERKVVEAGTEARDTEKLIEEINRVLQSDSLTYLQLHTLKSSLRELQMAVSCEECEKDVEVILSSGVLSGRILEFLRNPRPGLEVYAEIQHLLVWIFVNVSASGRDKTKNIIDSGAVQCFLVILEEFQAYEPEVVALTLWTLSNIAGGNTEDVKMWLVDLGVVERTFRIIRESDWRDPDATTWAGKLLANLVGGFMATRYLSVFESIVQVVVDVLRTQDYRILENFYWILQKSSRIPRARITGVLLASEVTGLLMKQVISLDNVKPRLTLIALNFFGNLLGTEAGVSSLLQSGVLLFLGKVFLYRHTEVKGKVVWCLSNICNFGDTAIQRVLESDVFSDIKASIERSDPRVKREIAFLYSVILTEASVDICLPMMFPGIVSIIAGALETSDVNRYTWVLVEALFKLYKLEKLSLEFEEGASVAYFDDDEEEEYKYRIKQHAEIIRDLAYGEFPELGEDESLLKSAAFSLLEVLE